MAKASSGTSAVVTSSAAAVTLITMPRNGAIFNHLVVNNTGTTDGFISTDNGTTWVYLPKGNATIPGFHESWETIGAFNVLMQRATGDLTGVFAFAEWVELKM